MSGDSPDNTIKDTPEQKYLAQIAGEKWNFAQEELAPLQNLYMEQVADMDSAERKSYIAGKVNTNTQSAVSDGIADTVVGGETAGLDPSSGRVKLGIADGAIAAAETGGDMTSRALFEQDSAKVAGLQNVVAMGDGQETQAVAGLSDIASYSGSNARSDAYTEFNKNSANLQLLGSVAGMGTAYYQDNAKSNTSGGLDFGGGSAASNVDLVAGRPGR